MRRFLGKSYVMLILLMITLLSGCTSKEEKLLNADKPITVVVWHYYNGNIKEKFDALVTEFNETVGMEKGIVIEAQSQGDVSQLATAVYESANQTIGSAPMPDIFASYADNAFRVSKIVKLVTLDEYFSEEEISLYRAEFLEEGKFITDQKYYIVPIAKSSENLYVNRTTWSEFAEENGFTDENISTWEGIYEVAEIYYQQTGKSFFSIDATANFFLASSMQLGTEIYNYHEDGTADFQFTEEVARKIWDYFYRPYIKSYFLKTGRFSSDDAKTGSILAYTGSTAGAAYFPTLIEENDGTEQQIESLILPYPYFRDSKQVSIQQGAGMCITKTDEAHEFAAALFLKWFTEPKQNLKFAVATGYFPVQTAAMDEQVIETELKAQAIQTQSILESMKTSSVMFTEYELYNSKAFQGSYEMRDFLEQSLMKKITLDLEKLTLVKSEGGNIEDTIEDMISEKSFENWYNSMISASKEILK
jgi:multiple sugar transport system substrate-binding protein